jgi:hypothetical protein
MSFFKKHVILGLLSGIGFILSGVWLWNGINYISDTIITQINSTTTSMVDIYTLWNTSIGGWSISSMLGTFFIVFGIFLLVVSSVMFFNKDSKLDFGGTDGQDSE